MLRRSSLSATVPSYNGQWCNIYCHQRACCEAAATCESVHHTVHDTVKSTFSKINAALAAANGGVAGLLAGETAGQVLHHWSSCTNQPQNVFVCPSLPGTPSLLSPSLPFVPCDCTMSTSMSVDEVLRHIAEQLSMNTILWLLTRRSVSGPDRSWQSSSLNATGRCRPNGADERPPLCGRANSKA